MIARAAPNSRFHPIIPILFLFDWIMNDNHWEMMGMGIYLRILNICCIVINIYECVWVLCIMLGWCFGRWQTWIRALFTFAQVSHSECTEWVYRLPTTLHRVLCGELRSPVWASQGGYRYGDDSYEDDLTWEKG